MLNISNYLGYNNKILILFNGDIQVRKSQEMLKHFEKQKVCNFFDKNLLYRFGKTLSQLRLTNMLIVASRISEFGFFQLFWLNF